jgi:predicted amidophosphoribosyltransferase
MKTLQEIAAGKLQIALANNKPPPNLFDVSCDMDKVFKEQLCGYCWKPLKFDRSGPMARCRRKRCPCPQKGGFFIRKAVLEGNLKIK